MFKGFGIGVLSLVLAACGAPRPRPTAPQNPVESAAKAGSTPSGRVYRVDEGQSELRVLVYRAGPLARFGHNHVMVNRSLSGTLELADTAVGSMFHLSVPAAGFVVDDAQARREEGADFPGEIPDDAKSGTLQNMLSAAVLDADEFPQITVNGVAIPDAQGSPAAGALMATVSINVAGHDSEIAAPFALQLDSHHLSATGSLELRQSALGLTPYSLMLGALQVQDAMTIKFRIVADEQAGS